jgi:hypothetical protein
MEMVSVQMQTWRFQVLPRPFYCISTLHFFTSSIFRKFSLCSFYNFCFDGADRTQGNRFNVVLEYDENEMLEFYEEEGLIQKEFEEHLSFKISSPATHRICGFNLFTWFSATPVSNPYLHVYLEIRNNTKGRVWVFYPSIFLIEFQLKNLNCYG